MLPELKSEKSNKTGIIAVFDRSRVAPKMGRGNIWGNILQIWGSYAEAA